MAEIFQFSFADRWSLITGGASGIGLACATQLARLGSHLVLLDQDAEALNAACAHLLAYGTQVRSFPADIRDTAALEDIAAQLDASNISIQHMVTAAGVLQPMHDIGVLDREIHDRVWDINYHGVYHACRIWGERMRGVKQGSIVTVSSITAQRATPLLAYGPAKAALDALTSSLAVISATDGVRVNAVAPGFTMTAALDQKIQSGQRDASSIVANIPMQRFVLPEEVANVVSFLLSDAASAVTGISLPVDCGWLAGSSWSTFRPLGLPGGKQ